MPWYFREGTEDRVTVDVVRHRVGEDGSVELPPEEWLWVITCGACQTNFTLRPAHGITEGADGALSTDHSFNCPKCGQWHRTLRGGVLQP